MPTLAIKIVQRLDEAVIAAQLATGNNTALIIPAEALRLLGVKQAYATTILDPTPREALAADMLTGMNNHQSTRTSKSTPPANQWFAHL